MQSGSAIALAAYALLAGVIGWTILGVVRSAASRLGSAAQDFRRQVAAAQAAAENAPAAGIAAPSRQPAAAVRRPLPAQAPRPRHPQAAHPEHDAGLHGADAYRPQGGVPLLAPFRGGEGILRAIIVAEALAPPIAFRRHDSR